MLEAYFEKECTDSVNCYAVSNINWFKLYLTRFKFHYILRTLLYGIEDIYIPLNGVNSEFALKK